MAFVERDSDGKILAIVRETANPLPEQVDPGSKEVAEFLFGAGLAENLGENWLAADLSLSRVIEDLVDILIKKELLEITDFPLQAQQKIIGRRGKRNDFGYLAQLFPSDDDDDDALIA